MFQPEFKNIAIIKFEIGTIINIDIMTKYGIFNTSNVYDYQTFVSTIDDLMTFLYNDEYIG